MAPVHASEPVLTQPVTTTRDRCYYTSWLTDFSDSSRTQLIFRLGARLFQLCLSVRPVQLFSSTEFSPAGLKGPVIIDTVQKSYHYPSTVGARFFIQIVKSIHEVFVSFLVYFSFVFQWLALNS